MSWGNSFGGGFGSSFGAGAGEGGAEAALHSVVLFPTEPLAFRRRADKALYAWACFMRDMRAPVAGYRPGRDHLVSAVALAAR